MFCVYCEWSLQIKYLEKCKFVNHKYLKILHMIVNVGFSVLADWSIVLLLSSYVCGISLRRNLCGGSTEIILVHTCRMRQQVCSIFAQLLPSRHGLGHGGSGSGQGPGYREEGDGEGRE